MIELVINFPKQLEEAKNIADKASIGKKSEIRNVVISGLGGSGIGGSIVTELFAEQLNFPITVNKDYFLPSFADNKSLVIISSYSGNTEETLSVLESALKKKCQIICVTSGGKVLEIAKQNQLEYIEIPGGFPPRSCIGYSLVQLIKIFEEKGIANNINFEDLNKAIDLLNTESENIKTEAKSIAQKLNRQIPVIYCLGSNEGVAIRFRQQINENAKALCWHHVFPEMNHNELVGWTKKDDKLSVITLHTKSDYNRTQKRYEVCKPIFEKYAKEVIDIHSKGETKLQEYFYLIHLTDYISCYMADLAGVDPVEVNVIDFLKKELSKL
ncbi:MAG: bifunctional phosphoglucose/phosphomannose isomerase [Bacteroidia bacterium]